MVCFTGDAGFLYHLPELETAVRHKLNTITVVNNNRAIAQGLASMKAIFNGRGNVRSAYEFEPIDFLAVAKGFGCFAAHVETPEQFREAFKAALAQNLPAVIEVATDQNVQPTPAWAPARK